jgi:hypothetical protein
MMMAAPIMVVMVVAVTINVTVMMVMPVAMPMIVPMIVPMSMVMRRHIRSVVRLERRRQVRALQAVLRQQRLDLGPFLQPDPAGENLHRDVAVAERHEEARSGGEIPCEVSGAQFDHRLGVGDDLGQPAVVEHQEVVGAQARRLGKIELDAGAPAAEHEALLAAAFVEFQQQRIGDLTRARCRIGPGA